jgi:predicted DNA-binding transcriptional regulator YafY
MPQSSKGKSEYEKALSRLARLLQGERFRTARELAARTDVSRVQVYRRLEALRALGVGLAEIQVRESSTGPLSTAYRAV